MTKGTPPKGQRPSRILKELSPVSRRTVLKRLRGRERHVADTVRPRLAAHGVLSPRVLNAISLHLSDVYGSCTDYVRHLDRIIGAKGAKRTLQGLVGLELEVEHISRHVRPLRRLLTNAVDVFMARYGNGVVPGEPAVSPDRVKGVVKRMREKLFPDAIGDLGESSLRRSESHRRSRR